VIPHRAYFAFWGITTTCAFLTAIGVLRQLRRIVELLEGMQP